MNSSTSQNPSELPQLASPGAGIPKPENAVAKLMLTTRILLGSLREFRDKIESEQKQIRALVERTPKELRGQRVLIDRIVGLEDSSRYWSVYMVLDHLQIVNNQIAKIVEQLSREIVPSGRADTATVKPSPDADELALTQFDTSCLAILESMAQAPSMRTKAKFVHPWFGPLSAFGWSALAGTHLAIHRSQIEKIISRLC